MAISDGEYISTATREIFVEPNSQDVADYLNANFVRYSGTPKAGADLGISFDTSTQERLAFMSTEFTAEQAIFNIAPAGICGEESSHLYIPVSVSTDGVSATKGDTAFALEFLSAGQATVMAKNKQDANLKNDVYTAKTYIVVDDSETGISASSMGSGINFESIHGSVTCGINNVVGSGGVYAWSDTFIADNINDLFGDSVTSFDYLCFQPKEDQDSSLLGAMRGTLTRNDSTPPNVTITERSLNNITTVIQKILVKYV